MNHPAVEKAAQKLMDEFAYEGPLEEDVAEIIERETKYSRLVELIKLQEKLLVCYRCGDTKRAPGIIDTVRAIKDELRSVLAEIKDLGNGPRR